MSVIWGKKKKPLATEEALQQHVTELRDEIKAVEKQKANVNALADTRQALETLLSESIEKLGDVFVSKDSLYEAVKLGRTFTEEKIASVSEEIYIRISEVEQQARMEQEDLGEKLQYVEDFQKRLHSEMNALSVRFDEALNTASEKLSHALERKGAALEESISGHRQALDVSIAEIRRTLEEEREFTRQISDNFEEFKIEIQKADEAREIRNNRLHGETNVQIGKLSEKIEDCDERAKQGNNTTASRAASELAAVKQESEQRLGELNLETTRLATAISEVENFATRRVEWVINNATNLKCDFGNSNGRLHTSWFSPKFDAGGCHDLQLELQMFRPSEDELSGRHRQEVGNLAAFLWACKGLTIAFRIYIGNKSLTMERSFNGRVPYGTPRLCWLLEQVNKDDDTLTIGLEILESVRQIEHRIQLPPPTENPEEHTNGDQAIVATQTKSSVEGALFFRRHISHRILDQVHREVELMRSRMIRKVEWRVQHAASLRSCFPKDEAICSPHFNAAGVEKMQFVFYPSGYSAAHNGFCSLYLYGPAGSSLHCSLSLGKQKRRICHSFDEPGAFGRTNFCSWATPGIIETDGTLTIHLEIEEAHQDMHTTTAHAKVVAGDIRSQPQIEGSEAASIESIVKLVRSSGKSAPPLRRASSAPGLEDHLILPSVWTPKQLGTSQSEYHGFDEVVEPKLEIRSTRDEVDGNQRPASPASPSFSHISHVSYGASKRPVSASVAIRGTSCTGLRKLASVPALRR